MIKFEEIILQAAKEVAAEMGDLFHKVYYRSVKNLVKVKSRN